MRVLLTNSALAVLVFRSGPFFASASTITPGATKLEPSDGDRRVVHAAVLPEPIFDDADASPAGRDLQAALYNWQGPYSGPAYNIPGFFFDVTASSDVAIKSLAASTWNGGDIKIFARPTPSTCHGHTFSSQGDWVEIYSSFLSTGGGYTLLLNDDLEVPAGTTRAFHVWHTGGLKGHWDNGPTSDASINGPAPYPAMDPQSTDGHLTVSDNFAVPFLFGNSFYGGYNLNGLEVSYDLTTPPPPTPTSSPTPAPAYSTPALCADADDGYNMCIDTMFSTDYPAVVQALAEAKNKWTSIITADIAGGTPTSSAQWSSWGYSSYAAEFTCNDYENFGNVPPATDDLYMCVRDEIIDGPSNVLGYAGYLNRGTDGLPITGRMTLDIADIASMASSGRLLELILHEMGHILGIGPLWRNTPGLLTSGLDANNNTVFTGYTGANACSQWQQITGCAGCPPVQSSGGHFDETVMDHEIMTPYMEATGSYMPISKITVGSLADMGYTVDYSEADEYTGAPTCGARRNLRNNGEGVRQLGGDQKEGVILPTPKMQKKQAPKISPAALKKAKAFGKTKVGKKNKATGGDFSAVEVVIADGDGTMFFVHVSADDEDDDTCKPNGQGCSLKSQCCSGNCHGNGKCVGSNQ